MENEVPLTPTAFKRVVKKYYRQHQRTFPWRTTDDPYAILVSEIMLQQTQTSRTVEKYLSFLSYFPTLEILATAPLANVLTQWSGLGYNRRALNLKKTAQIIMTTHHGKVPDDYQTLLSLPGIGPYTAGAVMAFAFNSAEPIIETNIRAAFIYHFFPSSVAISDKEIYPLIQDTLDTKNPCEWYWALMDYGAHLKSIHKNPSRKSKHHTKQSTFNGSDRQIRGEILRVILDKQRVTHTQLIIQIQKALPESTPKRIQKIYTKMSHDGLITHNATYVSIPH